jgi:HK97 family phage prohead protease
MMADNGKRQRETKSFPAFITKIDADQGVVEHLVAVFGNVDLGNDVIHPGSFTKTITERGGKVRVIDAHNYQSVMSVIGKPLAMWEVGREGLPGNVLAEYPDATGGLMARTQYLMDTPEGKGAFIRIKEDAVDEYSFGFDALDSDYEKRNVDGKEITVRNLRTLKLYEYGPVIFAMNPATTTLSAKEADGPEEVEGDGETEGGPADGGTNEKEMTPMGPVTRLGDILQGSIHKVFTVLSDTWYTEGFLNRDERIMLSGLIGSALDVLTNGMPGDIAQRNVYDPLYGGYGIMAADGDPEAKAGRVLAQRNQTRLVGALQTIVDVLDDAGIDVSGLFAPPAEEEGDKEEKGGETDVVQETQDERHADEDDGEPERFEPGGELDQDEGEPTDENETEITPPEDGAGDEQQTDEGAGTVENPPTYNAEELLQIIDIEQSELELLEV